jgi:hypothetical protein
MFWALVLVGIVLVFNISNRLAELHGELRILHDRIICERLAATGKDYITYAEKEANDLEKTKTDQRISALGSAIAWFVVLALSMNLLSHLSNQKRVVASYRNWREGVIEGASERSRGGCHY